ncbi:hypothetical protein ACFX15_038227 [Malus domestica]
MTSRKAQAVPITGAKNKGALVASGVTLGVTTRSKAKATSATSFTSASTLPGEREYPRHEPVITLASLRAPRGERPREYSESMLSDDDSSGSSAMQVMTAGATSVEEQLAQMNEAIARLTRTVEEKDLQIAALVNRLEAQDSEKPDLEDDPLKGGAGGDEEPPVKKIDGKPKPDQAAALMGSLSIQQLQEMITNTIKAQYEGSSYTSGLYSKPYSKKIDALRMPRGYQPPEPLHPTATSWPFDAWGLDVVGPIAPKSSTGEAYILAATDYFSKWAEAVPLKEVKKETVVCFIKGHIIHRYGVPRYIVTDNGKQFSNRLMDELCEKYKFKQRKSSMYHAPANGLAEAFNKTLCNLLKKVIGRTKKDWHERIGEALWAYRTTYRTPTQATPYSLVYGVEAVLPLESQIPSLRMAIQEGLTDEENAKLRLQELEALDEKRLEAQQHLECYQARLSKAFNKKVLPRSFQMGDLVLSLRRPIITTHKTKSKFTSKWDGPYVVQEVYTNGAYLIMAEDGLKIGPINGRFLKRYYP